MTGYKVLILLLSVASIGINTFAQQYKEEGAYKGGFGLGVEKGNYGGYQGGKQGIDEGFFGGYGETIKNGINKLGEFGGFNGRKEVITEEKKGAKKDDVGLEKINEWSKLIFNPLELIRSISTHFGLPMDKFVDKLGEGLVFGTESLLSPLVASAKIIEQVFVPDQCRLKFVCTIGTHLNFARETVIKFSPNFLEGSLHLKALTEGMIGRDCSASFGQCEPKLKKSYEELK